MCQDPPTRSAHGLMDKIVFKKKKKTHFQNFQKNKNKNKTLVILNPKNFQAIITLPQKHFSLSFIPFVSTTLKTAQEFFSLFLKQLCSLYCYIYNNRHVPFRLFTTPPIKRKIKDQG